MMTYNVSRETYDRLELCRQALSEWQNKFNLVSRKSLEDAWNRHFLDLAAVLVFPGWYWQSWLRKKHRI